MYTTPNRSPSGKSTREDSADSTLSGMRTPRATLTFSPWYPRMQKKLDTPGVNIGFGTLGLGHVTDNRELEKAVSLNLTGGDMAVNGLDPVCSTPRGGETDLRRYVTSPDLSMFSDVSQYHESLKKAGLFGYRQLRGRVIKLQDYTPKKRKKKK